MSEPEVIPPLTQSNWKEAACGVSYVAIEIDGEGGGDSVPSERGRDIHEVIARYIAHCAKNHVPSDWHVFNDMAAASGITAGAILDGFRDRYEVDWQHVYATEIMLGLDEDFHPAYRMHPGNRRYSKDLARIPGLVYSEKYVAHVGTLDNLLFSADGRQSINEDFKSTPQIFEADDEVEGVQGLLYSFLIFKHFPDVAEVTFTLNFVRYINSHRSVTFKRVQTPDMQAQISRARTRQLALHHNPDGAQAIPCKQCNYCPKMSDLSCPIRHQNEHMLIAIEDMLAAFVHAGKVVAHLRPLLKARAIVSDDVQYTDGNGKLYKYTENVVSETRYPLDETMLKVLMAHAETTGENLLDGRLNVSSTKLKSLIGTEKKPVKKRAVLREIIEGSCIEMSTKPKYSLKTPEGIETEFRPWDQE